MNAPLLSRELRRLAPIGLALALGLPLLHLLLSLVEESSQLLYGAAKLTSKENAAIIVGVLLGVATVSPDTNSGALHFLRSLPVSSWRVVGTKLGAALSWGLLALVIVWLTQTVISGHALERLLLSGLVAFSGGALASVFTKKVTIALVLAPVFCALSFAAVGGLAVLVGVSMRAPFLSDWVPVLAPALLIAMALVAFAKGQPERSPKPALVWAAVTLITASVLWASGTGVAYAWTRSGALEHLTVVESQESSSHLAFNLSDRPWYGRERRVAIVDRATEELWTVAVDEPVRVKPGALDPEGGRLLVTKEDSVGGYLVDLATREVLPTHSVPLYTVTTYDVLWRPEGPWCVGLTGAGVAIFDPLTGKISEARIEADVLEFLGVAQGAVYVRTKRGLERMSELTKLGEADSIRRTRTGVPFTEEPLLHVHNAGSPGTKIELVTPLDLRSTSTLRLSPTGRYLSVVEHEHDRAAAERSRLVVLDLESPGQAKRRVVETAFFAYFSNEAQHYHVDYTAYGHLNLDHGHTHLAYGADDATLAVLERIGGRLSLIDLPTGEVRQTAKPPVAALNARELTLAQTGQLTLGEWFLDAQGDFRQLSGGRVAGWLSAQRFVPFGRSVSVASTAGKLTNLGPALSAKSGALSLREGN